MLLMMLERGESIHSIVFFNTGWEFPDMIDHIKKLKQYIWDRYSKKVWTLYPRLPFEYWMIYRPIIAIKGPLKGKIHRIGNGWPSPLRRWCTGRKVDQIEYYQKPIPNAVSCIGYAVEESHRIKNNSKTAKRYPLIEWGVTEKDALKYCLSKGFDWNGLYSLFHRVSCFCCPLQRIGELKKVRKFFPELWDKMLELDANIEQNKGFRGYKTVHELNKRFAEEDRQVNLFPEMEVA